VTGPLLELRGVTKRFTTPDGSAQGPAVLDSIDLAVEAGASLAVVGPSGSGKSTLLNVIGGLAPPSAGAVLLEGRDLARLDEEELARVRNAQIGFVFQLHHLLPQCTALENVLVPTLVRRGGSTGEQRERALRLLAAVGLAQRADHRPAQLSGGECQRVAVVRALINRPLLLLADEPTGSLDGAAAEALAELFVELNVKEGVTLIAVTHSERFAARMGRVLALSEGRLTERA
jgi:predicted ABC-type transport system involved in lysophospholipase L1 biosynthesis ATPase subunit